MRNRAEETLRECVFACAFLAQTASPFGDQIPVEVNFVIDPIVGQSGTSIVRHRDDQVSSDDGGQVQVRERSSAIPTITKKLWGPSIRRVINPYNYEETSL